MCIRDRGNYTELFFLSLTASPNPCLAAVIVGFFVVLCLLLLGFPVQSVGNSSLVEHFYIYKDFVSVVCMKSVLNFDLILFCYEARFVIFILQMIPWREQLIHVCMQRPCLALEGVFPIFILTVVSGLSLEESQWQHKECDGVLSGACA